MAINAGTLASLCSGIRDCFYFDYLDVIAQKRADFQLDFRQSVVGGAIALQGLNHVDLTRQLQQCLGGEVGPSAAYSAGTVLVANEFAMASAIRLRESGGAVQSEIVWEYDEVLPEVSSPVGDSKRFYFVTSVGDMVALDATTGEEYWLEELSDGFYSSPILVGDLLYVLDREGKMYIVRASDEFELIASPTVGEPTLATPAT